MSHLVSKAFAYLSGVILAGMVCLICMNVVLRYVFDSPLIWVDQIIQYCMVYITFLGAPWVLARRRHIAIDLLQETLSEHKRPLLGVVIGAAGFLYCAGFAYLGWNELARVLDRDSMFADAIVVPQWTVYWVIPAGSILMALEFALNGLEDFRAYRRDGVPSTVSG